MRDNLEKAFKNSLEKYEVPYDSKAWNAVNARLDAKAAAGSSVLSNALKWLLASVLFGAVVTGSYFLWFNEGNTKTTLTAIVKNEKQTENSTIRVEKKRNEEVVSNDDAEKVSSILYENLNENTTRVISEDNIPVQNNQQAKSTEKTRTQENTPKQEIGKSTVASNEVIDDSNSYVAGYVSNTVICTGDVLTISNSTSTDKVRFQINGEWIVLLPGKTYSFVPKESAVINFVNEKNELIESKYIKINDLPTPEFSYEANIFDKGLPVVNTKAYGDYSSYTWIYDGVIARKGIEVRHNLFDKGEYDIQLKVVDRNGCEGTTSKTVRIRDKYNLMAVDAFKPNGSDARNRTFMPYSLTEREVRFQLTIVDPIDNGVVFTSSDAESDWDGTDQRTGEMTPDNKAYIWKVQIFDPVENERPIYAGTIVHN